MLLTDCITWQRDIMVADDTLFLFSEMRLINGTYVINGTKKIIPVNFACWVIMHVFLSSFFFSEFKNNVLQGKPLECQSVWIRTRPDRLPDPIWTQAGLHDDTYISKVKIGHFGEGGGALDFTKS